MFKIKYGHLLVGAVVAICAILLGNGTANQVSADTNDQTVVQFVIVAHVNETESYSVQVHKIAHEQSDTSASAQ